MNERWYCSRGCLEQAAREGLDAPSPRAASPAALPPLRLGVLLRHLGVLTATQLDLALSEQRATGLKLGAQLRALGIVSGEPILRALAAQGGVSYLTSLDLGRVRGCGTLPVATVRALGLVPFEVESETRRLHVACTAPVPRAAMRALLKLTGWTAEPYLVEDHVWAEALDAYRPAGSEEAPVDAVTLPDLEAAAARIADTAASERAVTVRHATCDDYTWVRIEGPQRVSDLLVTGEVEDTECQVQPIAH